MCQCLNQNIPYKLFFRNKELKGSAKNQERRNKMGEGKNKPKSGKALSIVTTNLSGTFVWNSPQQTRTQGFCLHRHCFWRQAVSLLANYGPYPHYSFTNWWFLSQNYSLWGALLFQAQFADMQAQCFFSVLLTSFLPPGQLHVKVVISIFKEV